MARGRSRPGWFRRVICNPVTTLLAVAFLLWDVRSLPFDPDVTGGRVSAVGRWYQKTFHGAIEPSVFMFDMAVVVRDGDRLTLIDLAHEPSWADVAQAMHERPGDIATFQVGLRKQSRGWWAPTEMLRSYSIDGKFGSSFTGEQQEEARGMFVDRVLARLWRDDPAYLARLRSGDFVERTAVPAGCVHNAATLLALGVLLCSLAWVPRTPAYLRRLRGRWRERRGLCPTCGYSLARLNAHVCPECGSAIARGRNGRGEEAEVAESS
jgi:hypothetical protein